VIFATYRRVMSYKNGGLFMNSLRILYVIQLFPLFSCVFPLDGHNLGTKNIKFAFI
jgi:hypothetical protein